MVAQVQIVYGKITEFTKLKPYMGKFACTSQFHKAGVSCTQKCA